MELARKCLTVGIRSENFKNCLKRLTMSNFKFAKKPQNWPKNTRVGNTFKKLHSEGASFS